MDQRASEADRSDVLQFNLDASDEPLHLTGPLGAKLFVSSDAIDTDFTCKLSDVFPTGEVRLLQDGAFRMRWREKGVVPVPMTNGEVYEIDMTLWNTSFVLAPGHTLRVSISSSNYPRFSVNANNMVLLNDTSYPGQNITAKNTLYHSAQYPSQVLLPVVTSADLPRIDDIKSSVLAAYPQLAEDGLIEDILERAGKGELLNYPHSKPLPADLRRSAQQ
jgi:putative CocE/NonD family hydrolase